MRTFKDFSIVLFAGLIGLLYGVIFTAQVLGFLKIYTEWLVIPITILTSVGAAWLYLRLGGREYLRSIFDTAFPGSERRIMDNLLLICGGAIILLLIFLPTTAWPYAPISETLHWDAGIYHFPKALEMVKTGSAWDLSIAYGEYPFGYESLIAFAAVITHNGYLFGAAHMLTCLYLVFGLWFILRRFSGLPAGISLFLSGFLLMSGALQQIDSNFWDIYRSLIYTIGKNDLFLGASILVAILHAPFGSRNNQARFYPFGLALATMVAAATKPNALIVLLPIWVWTIFCMWKKDSPKFLWVNFPLKDLAICSAVVIPGLLWAVRNLIGQGFLFSADANQLESWSIASNLTNPNFYQNVPQRLIGVVLIFLISVILAVKLKHITWGAVGVLALLLAGFALTPATAYFGSTQGHPEIGWRFGVALLAFVFVLPMMWLSPILNKIYHWFSQRLTISVISGLAVVVLSLWFIVGNDYVLNFRAFNTIVLKDQYRQSVGVDGYFSAYDYIQRNVSNSVVWVENGLPFYVYGPGFTNSTTRSVKPDYLVALLTPWNGGNPDYPEFLSTPDWAQNYRIVYQDSQGRVYKRLK